MRYPLQSHSRATDTIDWGVVLFLQADPHSRFCLLLFLYPPTLLLSAFSSPSLHLPLPVPPLLPTCTTPSPLLFSTSVPSVSEDSLQAHCHAASMKINNKILIQTDIKRHKASKAFLCRLLISPCFSTLFIFCCLSPSISSLEDSSGFHSPGSSEKSLDVTFDKFGRVSMSTHF